MSKLLSSLVIDVCICTFRRAELRATLLSVLAQEKAPPFRIIVADNDQSPSASEIIETITASTEVPIVYVHAPSQNISIARNACLEAAEAPWIAFLDDDQIATPHWLAALYAQALSTSAPVVLGPVRADYPADAPAWAVRADMHSTYPTILPDGTIATGYTGNVLINRAAIGDLRFDPDLGRSGGEDTRFFYELTQRGARIAFSPDADMLETVPHDRLKLSWLLRRSFRAGQTFAHSNRQTLDGARSKPMLAAKVLYCVGVAALNLHSSARWRRSLVRGALHAGALSALLGAKQLELY